MIPAASLCMVTLFSIRYPGYSHASNPMNMERNLNFYALSGICCRRVEGEPSRDDMKRSHTAFVTSGQPFHTAVSMTNALMQKAGVAKSNALKRAWRTFPTGPCGRGASWSVLWDSHLIQSLLYTVHFLPCRSPAVCRTFPNTPPCHPPAPVHSRHLTQPGTHAPPSPARRYRVSRCPG